MLLFFGVALVLGATRLLQFVQSNVFHTVPFGALSKFSISDACVGVLVSGWFIMYFGTSAGFSWFALDTKSCVAPLSTCSH